METIVASTKLEQDYAELIICLLLVWPTPGNNWDPQTAYWTAQTGEISTVWGRFYFKALLLFVGHFNTLI